jgi:hypothetical protein
VYLCHLLGVSFNALWRMRIDNGSLTIARPPRLVSVNDTTHLPPTPRTMWFDVSGAGGGAGGASPTTRVVSVDPSAEGPTTTPPVVASVVEGDAPRRAASASETEHAP